MNRYDRQLRLDLWDQDVIANSMVLIVGMGGTGCEVAKNLALSGVGSLIIVDPDVIDVSNLNRQFFYHERDVGKSKVSVAKERLLALNPDLQVETYHECVQDLPMRMFERVDIVAGCVDNFLARQYINSKCVFYDRVLIDSATDGYFGQVQVVIPGKTACLSCDSPEPPDETRILDEPCTVVGVPRKREHSAWKAYYQFFETRGRVPRETDDEDLAALLEMANNIAVEYHFVPFDKIEIMNMVMYHVPSISSTTALIAAIQTQELIKMLFLSKKDELQDRPLRTLNELLSRQRLRIPSLQVYAGLTSTFIVHDLVPDPECEVCSEKVRSAKKKAIIVARSLSEFREMLVQRYRTENLWICRNDKTYHFSELNQNGGKLLLRDGEILTIIREDNGFEEDVQVTLTE